MSDLPLTGRTRPDRRPHGLDEWRALGGYRAIARALSALSPGEVIDLVQRAGRHGRGGAGFPTPRKWRFMAPGIAAAGPGLVYLCVNGDEMEPGSFKDRFLFEAVPRLVVEGAMFAAYAIGASEVILLIRDAYPAGAADRDRASARRGPARPGHPRPRLRSRDARADERRPRHRRRGDGADRGDRGAAADPA